MKQCGLLIHLPLRRLVNMTNELTQEVVHEAIQLCTHVYSNKDDFDDVASLCVHKFLNQKSLLLLKLLPPTDDWYRQHVMRCALATIIDKRAHLAQPTLPPYQNFGWAGEDTGKLPDPIPSTTDYWPERMSKSLSCNCKTGCTSRNCSCSRRGVSCYIGCRCTGTPGKCTPCQDINVDSDFE